MKRVRDTGVMAGVSTHNRSGGLESKGWPVDYYMMLLPREPHAGRDTGGAERERPLGEAFLEKDPARMTAVIRRRRSVSGFRSSAWGVWFGA